MLMSERKARHYLSVLAGIPTYATAKVKCLVTQDRIPIVTLSVTSIRFLITEFEPTDTCSPMQQYPHVVTAGNTVKYFQQTMSRPI